MRFISIFLMILLSAGVSIAQNHPELDWKLVETEHFKIYYHQGLDRVAGLAMRIAEEIYGPITSLYHFEPDGKVRLIIKDTDDEANGLAFYYDNKIVTWATNLDHEFRGTSDWLRNVITHEFTHIISLQVSRKAPRRVPGFYLQYFGYQQEEDRDDILTGYPDVLASYQVPMTIVPPWFAEGLAQYQADGARHDRWDSHRDMILRMATLNGGTLSYAEMGVFEKNSIGNEMVYDHGYSLVSYIVENYGEGALEAIARRMADRWRVDFSSAIKSVLGISGEELHRRWREDLEERYKRQTEPIRENLVEGEKLKDEGYSNLHPIWSPDGDRVAYLSNKGRDFLVSGLYILSLKGDQEKVVTNGVTSSISWSPDEDKLIFSKKSKPNRYGSRFWDIYEYDMEEEKERRLTHGLRAAYPDYSPDGEWIVFVKNGAGTNNLGLMKADGTEVEYLTDFDDGTQIFAPKWSPDGERIVFSMSHGERRDIGVIPADGGEISYLVSSKSSDDRDPCWTPDGRRVIFSSDVTGVFNLYSISLDDRDVRQLTNVLGGAFSPAVSSDGQRIVFSLYGQDGYEIRTLSQNGMWKRVDSKLFADPIQELQEEGVDIPGMSKPYKDEFLGFSLMPRITIDDGRPKLGLYSISGDVLDKQSLLGGVLLGANLDIDLFTIYEYKKHIPTFFLEFYKQTRHVDEDSVDVENDFIIYETSFDLNEVDIGVRHQPRGDDWISLALIYSRYNSTVRWSPFNEAQRHYRFKPSVTYLNGFDLALTYKHRSIPRARDTDINPRGGRDILFRYDRMFNFFLDRVETSTGIIDEKFKKFFYNQFTLDWKEYLPIPWDRSTLALRFYGGLIDRKVDDFFDYHLGGINFMKGYTFYSLEGRKVLMGSVTYRFPIFKDMKKRLLHLYFDKLYGALYADVGRAWDEDSQNFKLRGFKRDVGGQLRLDLVSFYGVPTKVDLDLAYGLDEVEGKRPLKAYLSVLFGHLN